MSKRSLEQWAIRLASLSQSITAMTVKISVLSSCQFTPTGMDDKAPCWWRDSADWKPIRSPMCPNCVKFRALFDERKELRRQRGIALRAIMSLGRNLGQ